MYGNLNKPTFGATPTSSTFGFGGTASSPNPFGQNQLFGKTNTSTFGQTGSAFGTPASPLFGTTQQSAPALFGSGSTPSFASPPATQSGFGSTLFGSSQQPSSSTGLFGASTSFGQQNKPAAFGFSPSSTILFGQSAQPQQQNGVYPPTPSASTVFGSPTSFGMQPQQTGSVISFTPVTGSDTMQKSGIAHTINTKHHCITCMKEYEGKSFEELRWEDYQVNRKGPQQQAGFGAAPFATSSSAPVIFGQPENKPPFGQSTGFGQSAPLFGQSSGSFGLPNQANASTLFGKPPSGFGTATTTSSSFGFTSPPTSNLFGAHAATKPYSVQPTQNVFGNSSTQPAPGFGNTLFGQSNTQNANTIFNKPSQPTGFGGGQTSFGFGQTVPGTQNLYQPPKSTAGFNLFSQSSTTPSFGHSYGQMGFGPYSPFEKLPSTTSFVPGGRNGFGSGLGVQPGNSLFGTPPAKPNNLFGSTNTIGGGLFTNSFQQNTGFNLPLQQQQLPQNIAYASDAQNREFRNTMQITGAYGHTPHLSNLFPLKEEYFERATNPIEIKALLDSSLEIAASPIYTEEKIKVIPLANKKLDIFDTFLDRTTTEANNYLKKSLKRLIIRKKQNENIDTSNIQNFSLSPLQVASHLRNKALNEDYESDDIFEDASSEVTVEHILHQYSVSSVTTSLSVASSDNGSISEKNRNALNLEKKLPVSDFNENDDGDDSSFEESIPYTVPDDDDTIINDTCGVILNRAEYYTVPPLEELYKYKTEDGSCFIKGFTIGRVGYGNVYFPDIVDVSNLNIDEFVHFRHKELTIYPDDSKRPPLGQGLNRRAQVTLDRVWPRDTSGRKLITNVDKELAAMFSEKLQKVSDKHESKFLEYRPDTGSWVFMVDHFSKYGFTDSDEEEARGEAEKCAKALATKEPELKLQKELEELTKRGLGGTDLQGHENSEGIASKSRTGLAPSDVHVVIPEMRLRDESDYLYEANPKNVHLMKASFFEEDSVSDDISSSEAGIMQQYMDSSPPSPISSQMTVANFQEKPNALIPNFCQLLNISGVVPSRYSLLTSRNYMDMAMFKGRSFKVGWGKGFVLFCVSTYKSPFSHCPINECPTEDYLPNTVLQLQLSKDQHLHNYEITGSILEHLTILKEESKFINVGLIPTLDVRTGYKVLLRHQGLVGQAAHRNPNNSQMIYYRDVWSLIVALWGPDEDTITSRRGLFSEWLETVLCDGIKSKIETDKLNPLSRTLKNLFLWLSGHHIKRAAELAIEEDLPQLSLLISQLGSNLKSRTAVKEQIQQWKDSTAMAHINKDLLKLYLIVSGTAVNGDVNICEGIDWKGALAMHLWYISPPAAPLTHSIKVYDDAFNIYQYAPKPTPCYNDDVAIQVYNLQYHIMLLYENINYSLEVLLNPETYTTDPTDYGFSWLLLQTFKALQAGIISEVGSNHIHISFSSQLENMGYWKWALFVLLFLKDNTVKRNLILGILDRNLPLQHLPEYLDIEDEIVNNFKIPAEWIHMSKGHKYELLGQHLVAYKHLAITKDWQKCHYIAINLIFPRIFVNEDYDVLLKLLNLLLPGSQTVVRWDNEAGLLLDFLELQNVFSDYESVQKHMKNIQTNLISLCCRIKWFPVDTPYQSLCISELSKRVDIMIKVLFSNINYSETRKVFASALELNSLVMPPDYKQDELLRCVDTVLQHKP